VGNFPRIDRVLDFLFPRRCVGCGKEGNYICAACFRSMPYLAPPLCPKCGKPQPSGIHCPTCWGWHAEIDGIRSPFRFEGVIREAIHCLKYRNLKAISGSLAQLLAEYLSSNPPPAQALVPVPLHPRRLRERGYNQSGLLAYKLGKLIGLPVIEGSLVRWRETPPQARTATAAARRSNVVGAFSCRDEKLKGKQVLLIDDVCTSGATLDSCAAALKAGGAISVWGLTLAREI